MYYKHNFCKLFDIVKEKVDKYYEVKGIMPRQLYIS